MGAVRRAVRVLPGGPRWTRTTYLRVNTRSLLCLRTARRPISMWVLRRRTRVTISAHLTKL